MAKLIKRVFQYAFLFASVAVWFTMPQPARAQFIGYVSGQTVQQKVFTNQQANGSSVTLTNLGNASHFLSYCNTNFAGTISLVASPDGTFTQPITLATASYGQQTVNDNSCHVLQAGGYFPTVRAVITNYVSGSVNAWYSASGMVIAFQPPSLNTNGPASPVACDQTGLGSVVSGTTGNFVTFQNQNPSGKIYVCQMTLSFDAATTAGAIDIGQATDGTCTALGTDLWTMNVLATTPQSFTVGGPLGSFMRTLIPGRCLVLRVGAITAGVHFSVSFAIF